MSKPSQPEQLTLKADPVIGCVKKLTGEMWIEFQKRGIVCPCAECQAEPRLKPDPPPAKPSMRDGKKFAANDQDE